MATFVIYEVWTRAEVVEAEDSEAALEAYEPSGDRLSLANWHAVEVVLDRATKPSLRVRGSDK